jgi:hypothetical protein
MRDPPLLPTEDARIPLPLTARLWALVSPRQLREVGEGTRLELSDCTVDCLELDQTPVTGYVEVTGWTRAG